MGKKDTTLLRSYAFLEITKPGSASRDELEEIRDASDRPSSTRSRSLFLLSFLRRPFLSSEQNRFIAGS